MGSRLFHVSDIHFGREDPRALAWFAAVVKAERPDGLVVTGDYTYRALPAEFNAAAAWLESLDTPMTIEPGNHDVPYYYSLRRYFAPYRRFEAMRRRIERKLQLPDVAVLPLKTVSHWQWRINQSRGIVRRAHLRATLRELAALPAATIKLVAVHHPLADLATFDHRQRTRGGSEALGALAREGATAVLSGHVHDPFDEPWSGAPSLRLIGAGTLSARLRNTPPSFNELRVEGGRLEVRVREMGQ